MTGSVRQVPQRIEDERWLLAAITGCALAAALGIVSMAVGWRGADWPAQLYRVDLFRRVGFTQWDNQWYGGHHTPGYSVLLPPLGATFGVRAVGVASGVVATAAFACLVRRRLPDPRAAIIIFGVGTVSNLVVGRVTFGLGLAVGTLTLAALGAGRVRWAIALAALTPLSSPVSGVFVVIAGVAYAGAGRPIRRPGLAVAVGAGLPIGALALAFPEGGRFPFLLGDALLTVGVAVAAVVVVPREWSSLRTGAAIYALAAIAVFVVPNPLGGNFSRAAMYAAAPLAIGFLWPRRWLAIAVVATLVLWQWQPAFDGMTAAPNDPSLSPRYYHSLLAYLGPAPLTRIEIPFTRRHWEAVRVAPRVALARGWERQLDIGVNPLFYASGLDANTYHRWLVDNAIGFVALPDVELDESARQEAALLRAGIDGLTEVWTDAHWRVWNVPDSRPMVEGAARLTRLDPDSFTLAFDRPGDAVVRVRYSSHWDVEGRGCVARTTDGWTAVRAPAAGSVRVRQVVSRWVPFRPARPDTCPGSPRAR